MRTRGCYERRALLFDACSTARFERCDNTDHAEPDESRLKKDPADPTEHADTKDATEPIDRAEPTLSIDRMEPFEAMERIEVSDAIDHRQDVGVFTVADRARSVLILGITRGPGDGTAGEVLGRPAGVAQSLRRPGRSVARVAGHHDRHVTRYLVESVAELAERDVDADRVGPLLDLVGLTDVQKEDVLTASDAP